MIAKSWIRKGNVMDILTVDRIQLGVTAEDKMDAIRKSGELLVKSGCVKPAYVQGMLNREQTMSTYLDNGVAIPHGQYENRNDILRTGIAILQLRKGVVWEEDETAQLIVGIAAASDEHIDILTALSEVVEDEEIVNELIHTADAKLILSYLGKPQHQDQSIEGMAQ